MTGLIFRIIDPTLLFHWHHHHHYCLPIDRLRVSCITFQVILHRQQMHTHQLAHFALFFFSHQLHSEMRYLMRNDICSGVFFSLPFLPPRFHFALLHLSLSRFYCAALGCELA